MPICLRMWKVNSRNMLYFLSEVVLYSVYLCKFILWINRIENRDRIYFKGPILWNPGYRFLFWLEHLVYVLFKHCVAIKTLNLQRNSHSPYSEMLPSNKTSGFPWGCDVTNIQSLPSAKPPAIDAKTPTELMQKLSGWNLLGDVRDGQSEHTGLFRETGANTLWIDGAWQWTV